jgi:steroid delta-isomerase
MITNEMAQATIDTLFSAIRRMDIETWLDCFAPDAANIDPAEAPPQTGNAAIRPMLEGAAAAFQSIDIHADSVFINGKEAAVKWTADFQSKNGKTAHCEGVDVIEFSGTGKIQTLRAFWNPAAMMAQLAD